MLAASMYATKHRRVLSSIVAGFVCHDYVPDYYVYKNCVLHINTLLCLLGGLYCITMYGTFAYLPVFIFEGLEPLILQNGIKLRNIYHAGINIFSNLSFFYTPRGIDLFFVIIK